MVLYTYLGEYIYNSPQVGIYIYSPEGWGVYALYATSGAFEDSRNHGIYIYQDTQWCVVQPKKPGCHTMGILTGRKCNFHTYVAL